MYSYNNLSSGDEITLVGKLNVPFRKPRCLMYPKMHSDLRKALRSDLKGQQRLPWENRVRIALHTARALLYLHTEVTNERNVRCV